METMAKSILICDDAAFMRMMIKDILTKNGYNVAGEAENGAKGVEKYNELKPDLVLMDITMPEMDGIEALKAIKASDAGAKVIMCSAMGQQAMVIESIQAGAKDFIRLYSFLPGSNLLWLSGHDLVKFKVFRELILKWQNKASEYKKSFALLSFFNIGKLILTDAELLSKDCSVSRCLIEHVDKFAVLENVLDL